MRAASSAKPAAPKAAARARQPAGPSRLQRDLAVEILHLLKARQSRPGYHLLMQDICEHFGVSLRANALNRASALEQHCDGGERG